MPIKYFILNPSFIGMGAFGNEIVKLDVLACMLMAYCVAAGWGGGKEVCVEYALLLLGWFRLSSHYFLCISVHIAGY
jgi:hypothetical protein